MRIALILAGGTGSRMGGETPKQFLPLGGIPILARTIAAFDWHPQIDAVYLVGNADWEETTRNLLADYDFPKLKGIIPGGKTRQGSSFAGVLHLMEEGFGGEDVVLIHDAARPLVDARIISDCIAAAETYGACVTAVPVNDTVLVAKDGIITDSPDRSTLKAAQTPQAFLLEPIYQAHLAYPKEKAATDDTQVAMEYGMEVHPVEGSPRNLKITTPEDLAFAESLV